ncbi:hypothetical protein CHT99_19095 [Sphingobacterium cellulitidis]|nr:hypothetical protein CHT99_19095 [Sphingobacterium cellulitidis]
MGKKRKGNFSVLYSVIKMDSSAMLRMTADTFFGGNRFFGGAQNPSLGLSCDTIQSAWVKSERAIFLSFIA